MIGRVTIWEIIWTGGLPQLGGLPHLPGVTPFHVNKPLMAEPLAWSILSYPICTWPFAFYGTYTQFIDPPIYSLLL